MSIFDLPSGVRPLRLSKEKIKLMWEKFCELDVFEDHAKGNFVWFMSRLSSADSIWFELHNEQDELVGIMFAEHIIPKYYAEVHVFFWDRKLRGRETTVQLMIKWIFDHLKVARMQTSAPAYAKATIRFIKRIGFIEEGMLRCSYLHKDVLYDEIIFGLLKDEFVITNDGGDDHERRSTITEFEERSDTSTEAHAERPGGLHDTKGGGELATVRG
jgi:RimJ/RimL family protein N-acetyltransferase